jgi:cyclophilin family peptidyl-prolyl cis-trans isomerase
MMKIRRVIPDFLAQTGDARVTLNLRDFPNQTQASSTLGPFTINSSTTKVDTRARARSISLKVENTGSSQFWKLGTFRIDIQPDGRR